MSGEFPYQIEPPGPGLQTNALRVEIITPQLRCKLKPRTPGAAWELEHRPHHVHLSWSYFGACDGGAASCASCPTMKTSRFSPEYDEAKAA